VNPLYGTRFVEYLTVRRFEELGRMPEVIAAHLAPAKLRRNVCHL
jgi:hypothetical protein